MFTTSLCLRVNNDRSRVRFVEAKALKLKDDLGRYLADVLDGRATLAGMNGLFKAYFSCYFLQKRSISWSSVHLLAWILNHTAFPLPNPDKIEELVTLFDTYHKMDLPLLRLIAQIADSGYLNSTNATGWSIIFSYFQQLLVTASVPKNQSVLMESFQNACAYMPVILSPDHAPKIPFIKDKVKLVNLVVRYLFTYHGEDQEKSASFISFLLNSERILACNKEMLLIMVLSRLIEMNSVMHLGFEDHHVELVNSVFSINESSIKRY